MKSMLVIVTIFLLMAASPQPSAAPVQSLQALFDQATQSTKTGNWAAAIDHYDLVQARLGTNGNPRSVAIVRARKGEALFRLDRGEEAERELRAGLAGLPEDDASLKEDRYTSAFLLGSKAEADLHYAEAAALYARAEKAAADDISRLRALAGLARTQIFDDAAAALATVERAIALNAAIGSAKESQAQWLTLKGRALLNKGDFAAARKELYSATRQLGGLTQRVDPADIAARSDLAIAAMLADRPEEARQYLAYTGAGRLNDDIVRGPSLVPPPCGGADDLRPTDVVVVEFSIDGEGQVKTVTPIYASRQGPVALAFARAVREWSWLPEEVKDVDPFFRSMIRLELRCSKATERPSLMSLLFDQERGWTAQKGVGYNLDTNSFSAAEAAARAELARREQAFGLQSVQLYPVLVMLASNPIVWKTETLPLLARADGIARAHDAPADVLAVMALRRMEAESVTNTSSYRKAARIAVNRLLTAANDPVIARDAASLAIIRMAAADEYVKDKAPAAALALLRQVTADGVLPADNPIRIGALVRISGIEAGAGNIADARKAFEATGLDASQCALVDATPARVSLSTSTNDFPMEAGRWGFEGWAMTEMDVTAEGKTTDIRAIVAYPPFIFGPAATQIMQRARYTQSYRPNNSLGCGGLRNTMRFSMGS